MKPMVTHARTEYLQQKGIKFEAKNNGQHLIIGSLHGIIDYWPSTNKWTVRGSGDTDYGCVDLISYIEHGYVPQEGVTIEDCVVYDDKDAQVFRALLVRVLAVDKASLIDGLPSDIVTDIKKALQSPWD